MARFALPLVVLVVLSAISLCAAEAPIVKLDYVTLKGVAAVSSGVTSFKGIPYAAPPLGALRFRPPQAHDVIPGVFDATAFGPMCPGGFDVPNKPASEDCLFMNVWSPIGANSSSRLPVMVWIHGGGFVGDSTRKYDAEAFVANVQNVVVASMEYRLGLLGFFSNDAVLAEGHGANHGLRDQQFALEWVQKYITQFGGDPEHVTAWGESAGSMSTAMQMLAYNGSQYKLFQRAILESGALTTTMDDCSLRAQSERLAAAVGCPNTVGTEQLECLRAVPYEQLLNFSAGQQWWPVVDHVMFDAPFYSMLAAGSFMRIPILIGTNTNEGLGFGPQTLTVDSVMKAFHVSADNATELLSLYPLSAFNGIVFFASSEMGGDNMLVCPSEQFAQALSKFMPQNTFRYRWNHPPLAWGGGNLVPHFSEVAFVFNYTGGLVSPFEYFLCNVMQRLWSTFAVSTNANPNYAELPQGVPQWPSFNAESGFTQLLFNADTVTTEADGAYMPKHNERCALWAQLHAQADAALPDLNKQCQPKTA